MQDCVLIAAENYFKLLHATPSNANNTYLLLVAPNYFSSRGLNNRYAAANMASSKRWIPVEAAAHCRSRSIPISGISRSQSEAEDLAQAELLADYRDGQMYERISKLITCCSSVLFYAPV